MDLKEVREKIDTIDEKIADLFAARMDEVERVTEIKKANNLPVYSPAREREVLNKVSDRVPGKYESYARVLFSTMFELSRSYQSRLSVNSALEKTLEKALANEKKSFPERAMVACQGWTARIHPWRRANSSNCRISCISATSRGCSPRWRRGFADTAFCRSKIRPTVRSTTCTI